jgi:hypothetical protein
MKPQGLRSWGDVLKAIAETETFVRNLRDEVFYTRRGPYSGTPTMSEGLKVSKLLDLLLTEIKDSRSRSTFWQNVAKSEGHGHFTLEQAEQSLRAWTTDFQDAFDGGFQGGLTPILDKALKLLREDAKRIQDHDEKHPTDPVELPQSFKEFQLGRVKVVVDDHTVLPGQIQAYIKYLDAAQSHLKSKGFEKTWYGTFFIKCEACGGDNPYGKDFGVGGNYPIGPDVVNIFQRPDRDVVHLVVHELGHRWWFKFMDRPARLRFADWIENGLGAVSDYGSKAADEAFAEAFKHYVLDLKMTPQQAQTFKMVALGRGLTAKELPLINPQRSHV